MKNINIYIYVFIIIEVTRGGHQADGGVRSCQFSALAQVVTDGQTHGHTANSHKLIEFFFSKNTL